MVYAVKEGNIIIYILTSVAVGIITITIDIRFKQILNPTFFFYK